MCEQRQVLDLKMPFAVTVALFLHVYQQLVSLQLNIKLMGRSVTIAEQQKHFPLLVCSSR